MANQIRDGKGRGNLASVDNENRLLVLSTTHSELRHISDHDGKGFAAYTRRDFAAGSQTNENICYFKYEGTGECHIERIIFSTDGSNTKFEMFFDPTSVSGGATLVALNLNRGSNQESETSILTGTSDITATTAAANEFLDVRLNVNTFTYNFDGGLILGQNDEFLIKGSVATAGNRARATIYFYEHGA
jgi:hypothetical protein